MPPSELNEAESSAFDSLNVISDVPRILSRSETSLLAALAQLGAGDMIECYVLSRSAQLEPFSSHNSQNNKLVVRKSAIAFFYRPKGNKSPQTNTQDTTKKQLQLTLEYGPSRAGATLHYDTMPRVVSVNKDEKFVDWANDAKIYYTFASHSVTDIQGWDNAYYMAPCTGAVLQKVLNNYILDYTTQFPIYQPFVVRSINTTTEEATSPSSSTTNILHSSPIQSNPKDLTILKSSNSDDFVWNVIDQLALLYVDIDPLLTPNRFSLVLYITDPKRDVQYLSSHSSIDDETYDEYDKEDTDHTQPRKVMNVAYAAAAFYDKLYACIRALQTGDDSAYMPVTHSPSFKPTTIRPPSQIPSFHPTLPFENRTTGYPNSTMTPSFESNETSHSRPPTLYPMTQSSPSSYTVNVSHSTKRQAYTTSLLSHYSSKDINHLTHSKKRLVVSSSSGKNTASSSSSTNEDSIISTTSIISTCLSDPKYGIRRVLKPKTNTSDLNVTLSINNSNHSHSTTHIYLFLDGSQYLRINVTEPFLAIVPASQAIAQVKPIPVAKWDIIDWLIVLMIVYGFFYGIVAILDHLGFVNMQTFCVRWKKAKEAYANAHYSLDDDIEMVNDNEEEMELDDSEPGRYIPSSMGGWNKYSPQNPTRLLFLSKQRPTPTKIQRFPLLKPTSSMEEEEEEEEEEEVRKPYYDSYDQNQWSGETNLGLMEGEKRTTATRSFSVQESNHGGDGLRNRKVKDPDTVDMPDLSFSSPIAVPASANKQLSVSSKDTSEGIMT